jgi:hypothetical protein
LDSDGDVHYDGNTDYRIKIQDVGLQLKQRNSKLYSGINESISWADLTEGVVFNTLNAALSKTELLGPFIQSATIQSSGDKLFLTKVDGQAQGIIKHLKGAMDAEIQYYLYDLQNYFQGWIWEGESETSGLQQSGYGITVSATLTAEIVNLLDTYFPVVDNSIYSMYDVHSIRIRNIKLTVMIKT